MGFWGDVFDTAGKILEATANAMPRVKILQTIQEWEEMDGDDMEREVKEFVVDSSVEELEVAHELLGEQIKSNVYSTDDFQKLLIMFACFHQAWGVRDYHKSR